MNMIRNLLSPNEIADIVNNPIVQSNKEHLSTLQKVDFSIQLSDTIKSKLETGFGIQLSHNTSIPLRWIKGDTVPHIDTAVKLFDKTCLLYLTDSIGDLIIDGNTYPIVAGDAHIFSENIEHSTVNTGTSERLLIGPMSETGFHVGAASYITYYSSKSDADNEENPSYGYSYTLEPVYGITKWYIFYSIYGTNPSPIGGPYNTGDSLIPTGYYYVYPYIELQPLRSFSMSKLYTNNAQVYYKPNSLSTGGGGSGVKNSRHKQRKT